MKYLLVLLASLLAACSYNTYPTTVVEKKVVDCKPLGVGYELKGDTCVAVTPTETPVVTAKCVATTEFCDDKIDNDCDGETDETSCECKLGVVSYFPDADGDGFGAVLDSYTVCKGAPIKNGYVNVGGDCGDNNASMHPGADESCGDKLDNNCNGQVDELPCVQEFCDDGIDNDKDGETDETSCICENGVKNLHPDADGDSYGGSIGSITVCIGTLSSTKNGFVDVGGDCDDANVTVHTGADEICGDKVDNDCNGQVDGFPCVTYDELCGDNIDNDKDGLTDEGCICEDVNVGKSATGNGYAKWCNKCSGECHDLPDITVTKSTNQLVLVYGQKENPNWSNKSALLYDMAPSLEMLAFSQYKKYEEWKKILFPENTFVVVDLQEENPLIQFNVYNYPGVWDVCGGTIIDKIALALSLPKTYHVHGGAWEDVTEKIQLHQADDLVLIPSPVPFGGMGTPMPIYCAAVFDSSK